MYRSVFNLFVMLTLTHQCAFAARGCNADELRVPAFTAYMSPNPNSARISEPNGISRWNDLAESVNWYGKFETSGELTAKVELLIAKHSQSKLKLTIDGKWTELTTAKFSHDPTGKTDRLDRFMGVENDEFFLSHGGFVDGFTKYGEPFTRKPTDNPPTDHPPTDHPPTDLTLPAIDATP